MQLRSSLQYRLVSCSVLLILHSTPAGPRKQYELVLLCRKHDAASKVVRTAFSHRIRELVYVGKELGIPDGLCIEACGGPSRSEDYRLNSSQPTGFSPGQRYVDVNTVISNIDRKRHTVSVNFGTKITYNYIARSPKTCHTNYSLL